MASTIMMDVMHVVRVQTMRPPLPRVRFGFWWLLCSFGLMQLLACQPTNPVSPPLGAEELLRNWFDGQARELTKAEAKAIQVHITQFPVNLWAEPKHLPAQPGLHNVHQLSATIFTGSSPEGETGFASLRQLGIHYVISVDGATPEITLAQQAGLHYLHTPIGYDGVTADVKTAIASVIVMADAGVYIHCHHGKHRGPAAAIAGVRCLANACNTQAALAFIRQAGTDPKYVGLYRDAQATDPLPDVPLNLFTRFRWNQPSPVEQVVGLMVEIDSRWDQIKQWRSNNWKPSTTSRETLVLLTEHFREAARTSKTHRHGQAMQPLFENGEETLTQMQEALRQADVSKLEPHFGHIQQVCTNCHRQYRD